LIEAFVEPHSFLPKRHLPGLVRIERKDGIADKGSIRHKFGRAGTPKEGQPTAAYSARLLANDLVGFASNRDVHCCQPGVHRRTELNLPASCSHCLGLKVKQDHPRDSAIRDANWLLGAIEATLHQKLDLTAFTLPYRLRRAPMRQRSHRKASMSDANLAPVISHYFVGRLDAEPIRLISGQKASCLFDALMQD
jgi:hypothetical protein